MAFLDIGGPQTLADVLGQQADTSAMGIEQAYAKKRRQSIAQQAHLRRLRGGVSNYQAGDLAAGELSDLGGVQASLEDVLSGIPLEDYATQQDNQRKLEIAKLIGELSQSGGGPLDAALSSLSSGLSGAATGFAVGGPIGAGVGGAFGAGLGAYGGLSKRRSF